MKVIITVFAAFVGLVGTLPALEKSKAKADIFDQYGYVDLGLGPAPLPLPLFGIGYRMQSNQHGFNTNLRVATIIEATAVKAGIHYFRYFNPDLQKQFYIGVGPAGGAVIGGWHRGWVVSPELIFGKSYLADTGARRFFEVGVDFPVMGFERRSEWDWDGDDYITHGHYYSTRAVWFPLVTFHYGWGF